MAPAVGAQPAFLHSGLAWAGMGWGAGTWDGSWARSSSCQAEKTGEHMAGQATGEAVPPSQPWQLPGRALAQAHCTALPHPSFHTSAGPVVLAGALRSTGATCHQGVVGLGSA